MASRAADRCGSRPPSCRAPQASIRAVRQAPSARKAASQIASTSRAVPCDIETVTPRGPWSATATGLKWPIAWVRTIRRALPSELMPARIGLATSCPADQHRQRGGPRPGERGEADRDRADDSGCQQREAETVGDQRGVRRGRAAGERIGAEHEDRVSGTDHQPAERKRGGNARAEQGQARAAGDDEVAEHAARRIAGAGLHADQDRSERAEEQREQAQGVAVAVQAARGFVFERVGGVLDGPDDEVDQKRGQRQHERPDHRAALLAQLQ